MYWLLRHRPVRYRRWWCSWWKCCLPDWCTAAVGRVAAAAAAADMLLTVGQRPLEVDRCRRMSAVAVEGNRSVVRRAAAADAVVRFSDLPVGIL